MRDYKLLTAFYLRFSAHHAFPSCWVLVINIHKIFLKLEIRNDLNFCLELAYCVHAVFRFIAGVIRDLFNLSLMEVNLLKNCEVRLESVVELFIKPDRGFVFYFGRNQLEFLFKINWLEIVISSNIEVVENKRVLIEVLRVVEYFLAINGFLSKGTHTSY